MTGYYSPNPHYAPDDYSEERERLERAEEQAGRYFANATKPQTVIYHQIMKDLRGLSGPRYDRAREAARDQFTRTTVAASELCELTIAELMRDGEVSEALNNRWDALEAKQSAAVVEAGQLQEA